MTGSQISSRKVLLRADCCWVEEVLFAGGRTLRDDKRRLTLIVATKQGNEKNDSEGTDLIPTTRRRGWMSC